MKQVLFLLLTIAYLSGHAQKVYITTGGDTLKVGDTVYVGKGSLPDGKYRYIDGLFSAGQGQRLIVNKFIREKNANIARLYLGGVAYLRADIDYALDSRELMLKAPQRGKIN